MSSINRRHIILRLRQNKKEITDGPEKTHRTKTRAKKSRSKKSRSKKPTSKDWISRRRKIEERV